MIQPFRICALAIVFILLIAEVSYTAPTGGKSRMIDELSLESLGNRILIVTPHPDDETIAAGGFIQRALQAGKQVQLLVMTNGDGFWKAACKISGNRSPSPEHYRLLGEHRQVELLRAASTLGLSSDKIHFLGFPDGGLHMLWNQHWDMHNKYLSRTGHTECPYSLAYAYQVPYTGKQLAQLMESLFTEYQPTDIVYPAREDRHDDHWATQAFTQYVLIKRNLKSRQWSYLVHYPHWPHPHSYMPNTNLIVPTTVRTQSRWLSFALTPTEVTTKINALHEHKSQLDVMKGYLESFVRKNELFQSVHPEEFHESATLQGAQHQLSLTRKSGKWHLTIRPYPSVDPTFEYVVHLRSLSSESEQHFTSYGLENEVPNRFLQGAHHFFLSSEIRKNGKTVDQTSWVLYTLPPTF